MTPQAMLLCAELEFQEFEKIAVVSTVEGLKTQIFTTDGNLLEESIHEIEWVQMDLTLPNVENHAYRLVFESEPNIWRLVQYSITGTQRMWSVLCEPEPYLKSGFQARAVQR